MEPQRTHEQSRPPTTEKSWEVIMNKVEELDKGWADGWREDIDTLLVFAGLFSAVVTAFTIESQKKLSEDSGDSTVALLKQLVSLQTSNNTATVGILPDFSASPSYVCINTLWILSLILALVDALFCLVCKQWLREFQRPTKTKTPEELLALRCLRVESFEVWHIPKFLAALPIMLELALFLFFAGLLELLWMQNHILFAIAAPAVGVAVLFYIGTTLLPTLDLVRQLSSIHPTVLKDHQYTYYNKGEHISMIPPMHHLCPYKSPQALVAFRLISAVLHFPWIQKLLVTILKRRLPQNVSKLRIDFKISLAQNIHALSSWSRADLNLVQRFSRIPGCPDMYALKAFRWIVEEFQDTPALAPHLRNILAQHPPHTIMAAVFDRGIFDELEDWGSDVVGKVLAGKRGNWWDFVPFRFTVTEIQLLYYHSLWLQDPKSVVRADPPFEWAGPRILQPLSPHHFHFHAPLSRITDLLDDGHTFALGMKFLTLQATHRNSEYPIRPNAIVNPRVLELLSQFVDRLRLGQHHSSSEELEIVEFISLLSTQIANASIFSDANKYQWLDALDEFRESRNLTLDTFTRLQHFFPISLARLNGILQSNTPSTWQRNWPTVFRNTWQAEDHLSKNFQLYSVCDFIYRNLSPIALSGGPSDLKEVYWPSISAYPDSLDWTCMLEAPPSSLPLLTSDIWLAFLSLINNDLGTQAAERRPLYLAHAWEHCLDCIRRFNDKPPNYFPRINMIPIVSVGSAVHYVRHGGSFLPDVGSSSIVHPTSTTPVGGSDSSIL